MKLISILLIFTNIYQFITSTTTTTTTNKDNKTKTLLNLEESFNIIDIKIELINNYYNKNILLCWEDTPCQLLNKNSSFEITTFYGDKFKLKQQKEQKEEEKEEEEKEIIFYILHGKYIYYIEELFEEDKIKQIEMKNYKENKENKIVYIKTPECQSLVGYDTLAMFSDAIRRSTNKYNLILCFCSIFQQATSYTLQSPNYEFPIHLTNEECNCNSPNLSYDFWLPCEIMADAPIDIFNYHQNDELCELTDNNNNINDNNNDNNDNNYNHGSNIRLFYLHSTTHIDNLSMKQKIWYKIIQHYGRNLASLIMPESFDLDFPDELDLFIGLCAKIHYEKELTKKHPELKSIQSLPSKDYFILKDVVLHRQKGITIQSYDEILHNHYLSSSKKIQKEEKDIVEEEKEKEKETIKEEENEGEEDSQEPNYLFATKFLANPYLINQYKINIRRYILVVCQGLHLRVYVHNNGKCIYTPEKYTEPWIQKEQYESKLIHENNNQNDMTCNEKLELNKDQLITTGYVNESHYDDKPINIYEFYQYLYKKHSKKNQEQLNDLMHMFERGMHTRLALAIHATENLCEYSIEQVHTDPLPNCLNNSIRFQHFGCDFHIDQELTGKNSRLFECNKGPDMSVHSDKDGTLKREVASDFIKFIGLKGTFDPSDDNALKNNLKLIYDSNTFNSHEALLYLHHLENGYYPAPIDITSDSIKKQKSKSQKKSKTSQLDDEIKNFGNEK